MSLQEEVAPVSAAPEAGTSLLDNIMAQSRFQPESESYGIARQGVTAFVSALLQNEAESVDILTVNAMIADIDDRTSRQMDLILHDPVIQELESLLRSLKLLVERTDPRENIKIYLLHATKKSCWTISNSPRKSPSLVSISTFIQVVTDSLAASQWRQLSVIMRLKIMRQI